MSTHHAPPATGDNPHGLSRLERILTEGDMRHVSIVVMRLDDLPEMRTIYGAKFYEFAIKRIHHVLARAARGHGVAVRTGPTEYTLGFSNMYRREALALLSAQLGRPECFELDQDGEEIILVPEIAVDIVSPSESIRQCHRRLRTQLMNSMEQERARLAGMTKSREKLALRALSGRAQMKNAAAADAALAA